MNRPAANDDLRERIKTILRRDLKLGADAAVADDMPLFGGDVEVDSLDLLLLVSSLEREFGVRVPDEAVGETVFRSVDTLVAYVRAHRPGTVAAAPPPPVDPLARLPHGEPFRFVTRLESVVADDAAVGVWEVTGAEPFFAGHFPDRPVVPGVLLAEALAQVAGLIAPPADAAGGKLAHVDVRFDRSVTPPAAVTLRAKLVRKVVSLQQFEVVAEVGGQTVARGTLAIQHGA